MGVSTLYEIRNPLGSDKGPIPLAHTHTHTHTKKKTRRKKYYQRQSSAQSALISRPARTAMLPPLGSLRRCKDTCFSPKIRTPRCCHRNAQSTYTGDSPVPIYGSGGWGEDERKIKRYVVSSLLRNEACLWRCYGAYRPYNPGPGD